MARRRAERAALEVVENLFTGGRHPRVLSLLDPVGSRSLGRSIWPGGDFHVFVIGENAKVPWLLGCLDFLHGSWADP